MPLLKFRCKACGLVFDELTAVSRMDEVRCSHCGAEVTRAYEGACLFGMPGSSAGRAGGCSGNCDSCGGCGSKGHGGCGPGCPCH